MTQSSAAAAVSTAGDAEVTSAATEKGNSVTIEQAAAANQAGNSASASVEMSSGTDKSAVAGIDHAAIMGDLSGDPVFEAFKSGDGFDYGKIAKAYKDTKALVGQKLGIPGADATPEAKAAFYKALGVPDNVEAYEFGVPDGFKDLSPEFKGFYEKTHIPRLAKIAKELNLTKEQAQKLKAWDDTDTLSQLNDTKADIEKSNKAFDEMARKIFGDKAETAMKNANVILQKHVPEALRADLANSAVPDSVLLALAAAISGATKDLTGEDKTIGDNAAAAAGQSVQQMREEARKIQSSPEFQNPFAKGKEAHEEAKKRVKSLYDGIAKA